MLFPPQGKDRQALEVTNACVEFRLKNAKWIAECRRRLNDLGWFMKRALPVADSSYRSEANRRSDWSLTLSS